MGLILTLQDVTYLRDQEARREQLMATLSHELRTPLTSLRMAADLLARADLPQGSEGRSLIDAAREDVSRLEDVAQRLLELSRSRAMTIGLEREKISLRDLVARGGASSSSRRASGRGARDRFPADAQVPATRRSSAGRSRT
jgi:signal transduction histidine kinase